VPGAEDWRWGKGWGARWELWELRVDFKIPFENPECYPAASRAMSARLDIMGGVE